MPNQSNTRSELASVLVRLRHSFYLLGGFSGVINVMMLTPAVYMLQVYDRALVSRNVTTLAMLTVLVIGLFLLMSALEMIRTRMLIRVGNCMDMELNRRIFTAAFERNLSRAGGNPAQALQDLAQDRRVEDAGIVDRDGRIRGHRSRSGPLCPRLALPSPYVVCRASTSTRAHP